VCIVNALPTLMAPWVPETELAMAMPSRLLTFVMVCVTAFAGTTFAGSTHVAPLAPTKLPAVLFAGPYGAKKQFVPIVQPVTFSCVVP
jgi:hypothetical protein